MEQAGSVDDPGELPDLLESDVEVALRASVSELLAARVSPAALVRRSDGEQPYDLELWTTLTTDLGLAGLAVPEALGGQGASWREVAVVAEELGRSVAPVPFLGSAVLATAALLGCDPAKPEVRDLLRDVSSGSRQATLAVPLSSVAFRPFPEAVRADAEHRLGGRVGAVVDAEGADLLIVAAMSPAGPCLYAVNRAAPGVTVEPLVALDLTRRIADVRFEAASGQLLAGPDQAGSALQRALTAGAAVLAAEQVGLAQWCLDTTVSYLRERHQFGRPVGSFQAVKHRLAQLWLDVVTARAAARYAVVTLAADGADTEVAVSVAQAQCALVAVRAAEECVQLHGGIGMTWEHPARLYLGRAKSDEIAFGTPGTHRGRLATLVDLAGR